jgi:hypothetical protein
MIMPSEARSDQEDDDGSSRVMMEEERRSHQAGEDCTDEAWTIEEQASIQLIRKLLREQTNVVRPGMLQEPVARLFAAESASSSFQKSVAATSSAVKVPSQLLKRGANATARRDRRRADAPSGSGSGGSSPRTHTLVSEVGTDQYPHSNLTSDEVEDRDAASSLTRLKMPSPPPPPPPLGLPASSVHSPERFALRSQNDDKTAQHSPTQDKTGRHPTTHGSTTQQHNTARRRAAQGNTTEEATRGGDTTAAGAQKFPEKFPENEAFRYFLAAYKARHSQKFPDFLGGEADVSAKAARAWASLSVEDQHQFAVLAASSRPAAPASHSKKEQSAHKGRTSLYGSFCMGLFVWVFLYGSFCMRLFV